MDPFPVNRLKQYLVDVSIWGQGDLEAWEDALWTATIIDGAPLFWDELRGQFTGMP